MVFSTVLRPYRHPRWASEAQKSLGRTCGSILGGVLGRLGPRTLGKPIRLNKPRGQKTTDRGVNAWAGTTPVLGGLRRPNPAPRQTSGESGVVPAHALTFPGECQVKGVL